MLLSVVTSTFNGARFLPACLESVLHKAENVSCVSVEHIVVDAASSDDSVNILSTWQASQAQRSPNYSFRWITEPDRGQSEGFNKGVRMASGRWICWLNSDDELAPGALQAFGQALSRHPKADVIYGHVQFIDEASKPVKTVYTFPYRHWLVRQNVWLPPSSGTYFRRELFLQEPLDPDFHFVMDVEWFLRVGKELHGVLVDQVMSRFRISTQGKTSAMITNGSISPRHHEERERYRQRYIYSQWPNLSLDQAQRKLARHQQLCKIYYYWLKARYIPRYIADRLLITARTALPEN
jgi:glycosyltransferase involved in cell wall biosynthesis